MTAQIHRSKVGTYHPAPLQCSACPFRTDDNEAAMQHFENGGNAPRHDMSDGAVWTINDTSGYMDAGPACDECGACECDGICDNKGGPPDHGCAGLSFAFICLDGGEALCEACAAKEGIEIVPCDCE